MRGKLKEYREKRDFRSTREPSGLGKRSRAVGDGLRFVVQKHDARRLHYDFRLEWKGVLKSWAVPKGIPIRKGERRLAMEVEDHPVEYGRFEGTIPAGEYGAGTVQLWDRGRYEGLEGSVGEGLRKGKLSLVLHGNKLKGKWTLVRTRSDEEKPAWLIIRTGESMRPLSAKARDTSVASGKTMAALSRGRREWRASKSARGGGDRPFKERVRQLAEGKGQG